MKKLILHLCADIGSDSQTYRDKPDEYEVICIGRQVGVENYHPPENVYGVIANPPCTNFSIARTNAKTPRDMREGTRLVQECLRIIWECQYYMVAKHVPHKLSFWVIENPATGYLKHYLGKPVFEYCPSDFGEDYTKRTALWGYFNAPKKPIWFANKLKGRCLLNDLTPITSRHNVDPIERMNERSKVSPKSAQMFFEANR